MNMIFKNIDGIFYRIDVVHQFSNENSGIICFMHHWIAFRTSAIDRKK